MPDSTKPSVEVFFTPEFKRNVRALAKKYHHIQSDVQPIIDQIQRGELAGRKPNEPKICKRKAFKCLTLCTSPVQKAQK